MASTISTSSLAGCDDGVLAEVLPQPLCKCGIPAKLGTSMTSENSRRLFFIDVDDMENWFAIFSLSRLSFVHFLIFVVFFPLSII